MGLEIVVLSFINTQPELIVVLNFKRDMFRSYDKGLILLQRSPLLVVEYFHVVFTVPTQVRDIAFQNKVVIYNIRFSGALQTLLTIGKDLKHLGAKLEITATLHTWGSAMTHHPHLHCIVTGGGLSAEKQRWESCRQGFLLHVNVLTRLFRRLFLEQL